jgi:hypothetical protein
VEHNLVSIICEQNADLFNAIADDKIEAIPVTGRGDAIGL